MAVKSQQKIPTILNGFLIYLSTIKGKAKGTKTEYRYDLILMFQYIKAIREDLDVRDISNIDISDIKEDFIKEICLEELYAFLEYCEEVRNNSPYARARKVASMKSFFKYLVNKKKIISNNPAEELETPKLSKRNPIYMTLDETEQFILGIRRNKHYYRNICIIQLFLNCGMRISELCSINISSIKNDTLTVIGKGDKERTIYLNEVCVSSIKDYIENERCYLVNIKDNDALFISQLGTRLTKRAIQKLVDTINKDSGLNKEKLTPHKLRHTSATLMYKAGADIRSLQMILGHTNVSTTQIYTHVDDDELRSVVANNPLNKINS